MSLNPSWRNVSFIQHLVTKLFRINSALNLLFRCADNDPTVEIYSNGESHQSRFKFQMFKWRWSGDPLFLHCEVDICNKSTEECTSRDQAVS